MNASPNAIRFTWLLLLSVIGVSQADPLGSGITYQGELTQKGAAANGQYDFQFDIFDAAMDGLAIAPPMVLEDVEVVEGVFAVELDFGTGPFAGDQLWLEINVRQGDSTGSYTQLQPRQKVTAAPYAIQSQFVADNAVGSAAVDSAEVQLRVAGDCAVGEAIRTVAADGSVSCEQGLVGPQGDTGPAGPQGDPGPPGPQVTANCTDGAFVRAIDAAGLVTCEDSGVAFVLGALGIESVTEFGGSTYFLIDELLEGDAAQARCESFGANLASISSPAENALIPDICETCDSASNCRFLCWIGGHDKTAEGTLEWYDGTPVTYTNFVTPDGNDDATDCVSTTGNASFREAGLWEYERCANVSVTRVGICEK